MGANDAIKAVASQPIGETVGLRLSADYKKYQALMNSYNTTQGIYESIEAYQKRMQEFRENLKKRIIAQNTKIAEKQYLEIQDLALFQTNDPWKLQQGQNQISALKRFTNWNITKPLDMTLIAQQQATVEEKLYQLKKGQQAESEGDSTTGASLYNGEWQGIGQRNFLS